MDSSDTENSSVSVSLPRENLIETAVRFLTNPSVVDRPIQQKQSFLKSKGLTDDEIRISCERANVLIPASTYQQDAVIPMYGTQQQIVSSPPSSIWMRMRNILHTMALLGGLGYMIYWVYKAYIEPFLFGHPKPKKSTEESLSSIEEAIINVSRSTNEFRAEIRSELSRLTMERESGAVRNLTEIKSDIATVKGLLLSRQQFPSAPSASSLRSGHASKPSIPAWQLSTEQKNSVKDDEGLSNNKDLPNQPFEKVRDVTVDATPKNAIDTETTRNESELDSVTISESSGDGLIPNGNEYGE